MAGSVGHQPGGIGSLARLINGDAGLRSALNADLISLGLRLRWVGTEVLSWADLWDIVGNLSVDSAVGRCQSGLTGGISLLHLLLQEVANGERVAMAQRTSGKHKAKPKLIDLLKKSTVQSGFRHTPTPVSREELDRRLGWHEGRRVKPADPRGLARDAHGRFVKASS